jgi:hypothetical protein
MHYAAGNQHTEIVAELIAAGADCTIKNRDGYTPIQYVRGIKATMLEALAISRALADTQIETKSTPAHSSGFGVSSSRKPTVRGAPPFPLPLVRDCWLLIIYVSRMTDRWTDFCVQY